MVIYCCVKGCQSKKSTASRLSENGKTVSFHRLTPDAEALMGHLEFKNKDVKWKRICSLHIDERLKYIFKGNAKRHPPPVHEDHCYTTFSGPIDLHRKDEVRELKAKIRSTEKKCKRQAERIKSQELKIRSLEGKVQELIMRMKESDMKQKAREDAGAWCEGDLHEFLSDIQHNVSCSNTGRRYSEKMKEVAVTINKISPKCYRYLKTIFPLPSKVLLKKIIKSGEGNPGEKAETAEVGAELEVEAVETAGAVQRVEAMQSVQTIKEAEAKRAVAEEAVQAEGIQAVAAEAIEAAHAVAVEVPQRAQAVTAFEAVYGPGMFDVTFPKYLITAVNKDS